MKTPGVRTGRTPGERNRNTVRERHTHTRRGEGRRGGGDVVFFGTLLKSCVTSASHRHANNAAPAQKDSFSLI